ncbi:hypothetical protein GCM10027443_11350 [Pontibacter brevis]
MSDKANLLVVGDYNRKDFLELFRSCRQDFNFYFLEYASKKEVADEAYKVYGKAIFWGDFKNVNELLLHIQPQKVVFFFIESYFHVILNLACKERGIFTYLMDHGIRDLYIHLRFEQHLIKQTYNVSPLHHFKKITQFKARLKARLFLRNSVKELSPTHAAFFRDFYNTRRSSSFMTTFNKISSPLRVADAYISFGPKTFEAHQHFDHLPKDKPVHFIGLPNYDHLAGLEPANTIKSQIIFIDQGLGNWRFFNWNATNYRQFVTAFAGICATHGYQLLTKLHPAQPEADAKFWASFTNVKLIDNNELLLQLPHSRLIMGFYSTYLLPLMVLPFTTVVTLENHPMGRIDVSKSFVDAGVAHPVYDLEELHSILPNIGALHQKQLPNKAKFTEEWMYKFDGRAGERLRNILLSDKL